MKNAGNKNREPHQDEVRDLGAAARRQGRGDKLDARYKRQRKGKRKGPEKIDRPSLKTQRGFKAPLCF